MSKRSPVADDGTMAQTPHTDQRDPLPSEFSTDPDGGAHHNQAPSKRLSRKNGRISGVSGGLADYLDVDPTVIRLGFIGAALLTGPAVLVAYVAAWAVMPDGEANSTPAVPTPPTHPAPPTDAPVPPPGAPRPAAEDVLAD